jgi:hypothetical protein
MTFGLACPTCGERGLERVAPSVYRCSGCMYDFDLAFLMHRLMEEPRLGRTDAPTTTPIEGRQERHPRLSLVKENR